MIVKRLIRFVIFSHHCISLVRGQTTLCFSFRHPAESSLRIHPIPAGNPTEYSSVLWHFFFHPLSFAHSASETRRDETSKYLSLSDVEFYFSCFSAVRWRVNRFLFWWSCEHHKHTSNESDRNDRLICSLSLSSIGMKSRPRSLRFSWTCHRSNTDPNSSTSLCFSRLPSSALFFSSYHSNTISPNYVLWSPVLEIFISNKRS